MSEHAHGHPHGAHHGGDVHGHAPDTTTPPANIMERLKAETWPLHQKAERTERQRRLMKGELSRDEYASHLGQLYHLHKTLEDKLVEAKGSSEPVAKVVKDYQLQVPYLVEDLNHFGVEAGSIEVDGDSQKVMDRINANAGDPLKLLGMHYVLEGSNNGGRFIAMALRKHYELTDAGVKYMDPYGEKQRELWAEFKGDMNSIEFTADEEDRILEGANEMFRAMIEVTGDDPALEEETVTA